MIFSKVDLPEPLAPVTLNRPQAALHLVIQAGKTRLAHSPAAEHGRVPGGPQAKQRLQLPLLYPPGSAFDPAAQRQGKCKGNQQRQRDDRGNFPAYGDMENSQREEDIEGHRNQIGMEIAGMRNGRLRLCGQPSGHGFAIFLRRVLRACRGDGKRVS